MKRFIIVPLILALLVTLSLAIATAAAGNGKDDPFVGAWESIDDTDGSHQWLWIEADTGGVYAVTLYDDSAAGCNLPAGPGGPPTLGFGGATIDPAADDVLQLSLSFWCLDDPPWVPGWGQIQEDLTYDQTTETLDMWVTWYGSKDKAKGILP
jgi:hypothetical protein